MYILMNFFITFLIFIIVLFLYVHIIDQYKKNEDLEIFELDFENNYQLQKTCNLKQPFVFDFRHIIDNLITFDVLNINKDKDVSLKDSNEYYKENATESIDSLLLSLSSCYKLIEADINSHYYSENNTDFIIENDLYKEYTEYDKYLMPNYTVQKKYDFSFGSKNCYTPLLYHTNYRKFICVNSGKISVKMTPFKSSKYLHAIHDYENYEFRSPVNVWSPQDNYSKDFEKLKFLEFDVNNGDVLYVPSYC